MTYYAQGGRPPGLMSPNWTPLKTWHVLAQGRGFKGVCGAPVMASPHREALPGGARLCTKCVSRTTKEG